MRIYFIFISYMLCNLSYLSNAFVNINIYGTGLYLPYSMGVIGYIKNNIPIKNYNITGISGGAWCSLLYTQVTVKFCISIFPLVILHFVKSVTLLVLHEAFNADRLFEIKLYIPSFNAFGL